MSELTSDELIHLKAKERIAQLEQSRDTLARMAESQEKYIESQRRRINKGLREIHDLRGELKRKTDETDDLRGELKRIKDSDDCQITGVKTPADRNRELLKSAVDLTDEPPDNHKCKDCGKEFWESWGFRGQVIKCPDCGSAAVAYFKPIRPYRE